LTSPEAVQTLLQITKATGHTPVVASDTPGFIVNHAGRGYGTEALRVVGEGVATFPEVDRIMREVVGFRMGPFELLDLTGLDVSHPVMESIYQQYYHEPRFRPSPLTRRRMAAGLLGKKVGRGFYTYRDGVQVPAEQKTLGGQVKDFGAIAVVGHDQTLTTHVTTWLRGWGFDEAGSIASAQIILCAPLGEDLTTFALRQHLDPTRCIGIDALFQPQRLVTLMRNPATNRQLFENFAATLQAKGVASVLINDSAGFIAQRIFAHVVNVACEMAQSRVGQPEDIDLAVRLGLGYPQGPLDWGDKVGAEALHEILRNLFKTYEDPRYRASVWLARRAALKLSLKCAD
jgi:3-hydroxybutyryl-CoA dehydrogenase